MTHNTDIGTSTTFLDARKLIDEVISTIASQQPKSLVYCTAEPIPAIDSLKDCGCYVVHARSLEVLEGLPVFELGIVFDFLEHQSPEIGAHILGRLRNFNCERIWAAVTTSSVWNLNAMIALGFKRETCLTQEVCSYSYDICTYNHKREWNTPRFWANPENWGKYRW